MVTRVDLPEGYKPSETEEFMNLKQLEYFRQKLLKWKQDIYMGSNETLTSLQEENVQEADINDRASHELERAFELRTRDRERKLLNKIEAALQRIQDGSYGYCEESGEPITLGRLEARPIATLSIEAQERHERKEKVYKDLDY